MRVSECALDSYHRDGVEYYHIVLFGLVPWAIQVPNPPPLLVEGHRVVGVEGQVLLLVVFSVPDKKIDWLSS